MDSQSALTVVSELPADLASRVSRALHLKGFGEGKLQCRQHDEAIFADLCSSVGGSAVVAWDGDLFHEESFTRFISRLLRERPLIAVAYGFASMRDAFVTSWAKHLDDGPSKVYYVEIEDPCWLASKGGVGCEEGWLWLGREAIRLTGASRVMTLGGGSTAAEELAAAVAAGDQVHWTLYKVPRMGSAEDFGQLYVAAKAAGWSCLSVMAPGADGSFHPEVL